MIPWAKPFFVGREKEYVIEALESSWISGGPFVRKLETFFQNKTGLDACAVSNGTVALHLAYVALGLQRDDEILVPAFGFMAAANTAINHGIKPIFTDVDSETWCMTVKDLDKAKTPKTKAAVVIHTYGNVCDMDEIIKWGKANNIFVIEDTAEALGSLYKGKWAGSFGDINTFSLHATKTITTGEGGIVVCQTKELYEKAWLYTNHGLHRRGILAAYSHEVPGFNYRLGNIQAAIGVAQSEHLDTILKERNRVYQKYQENLQDIQIQKIGNNVSPIIWALGIKLQDSINRNAVMQYMEKMGVETRPGFSSPKYIKYFKDLRETPISDNLSDQIITLPFYPSLSNEKISYICDSFLKGLTKC